MPPLRLTLCRAARMPSRIAVPKPACGPDSAADWATRMGLAASAVPTATGDTVAARPRPALRARKLRRLIILFSLARARVLPHLLLPRMARVSTAPRGVTRGKRLALLQLTGGCNHRYIFRSARTLHALEQ